MDPIIAKKTVYGAISICEILPDFIKWLPSPKVVSRLGTLYASVFLFCLIFKINLLKNPNNKERKSLYSKVKSYIKFTINLFKLNHFEDD